MQYRNTISSMQAMLDLMTGLRKIREHIPVREAVSKVMKDRREFVCGRPLSLLWAFLTHLINVCGRRSVSGIVRVRLAIRMRKRLPLPPAVATISPISPTRARHAGLAHRTVHAPVEAGARAVTPVWLCGRRGLRRPGGHT